MHLFKINNKGAITTLTDIILVYLLLTWNRFSTTFSILIYYSQQTFTCSKSTMEIKRCKICLELTIKAPERLNVIVWCLLTLNIFHTFFSASFINFEQVFFYWFVLGAFIINLVRLELLTQQIISFPVSRTHLL